MDPANYKQFTVSRGFTYVYYRGEPSADSLANTVPDDPPLPALLFLHGFPTSSRLWRHQIRFFCAKGFVVLAPDLMGLGASSKPRELEVFRSSYICKDVVELLDAEKLDQVIVIGHDLGSRIVSRLANLYPDRFIAFGFLSKPYSAPRPSFDFQKTMKLTKKMCGYELCGHTCFYSEEGADKLIESQLDSFMSAIFAGDPTFCGIHVAPLGALKSWLQSGGKTKIAPYVSNEDLDAWRGSIVKDGIASALLWSKALVTGLNAGDDKCIPVEKYKVVKPVFFGAACHDYISTSLFGNLLTNYNCDNATIREFQDGHWLMLSSPEKVNAALFSWIMDCF